jgi:integrase
MSSHKRGSATQYLKLRGLTWSVSVSVPRPLRPLVRNLTHLRRSLHTRSLDEANILKHAVVAQMKEYLNNLAKKGRNATPVATSTDDARPWREEIMRLTALHGEAKEETTDLTIALDHVADKAEEIETRHGLQTAQKWYKAATSPTPSLAELHTQWLGVNDWRASTKESHKATLTSLLGFLQDDQAFPRDVTRQAAITYLDQCLTQKGLSYSTIRSHLSSLGSFWGWMASRGIGAKNDNPWTDHRLSKVAHKGRGKEKRAFTEAEVVSLLEGTEATRKWPTSSYLPDLIILGLYSACREEELCSLRAGDVEFHSKQKAYILNIRDAKTQAGIRPVAITAQPAMAVLQRRTLVATTGDTQLFPELSPGGTDMKYSSSAIKAFVRYRRACGVPDGTDYHSFRRLAITMLEHQDVRQVNISRYVGHKVGTLAADTYSAGGSKAQSIETSRKLVYGSKINKAAIALASRGNVG